MRIGEACGAASIGGSCSDPRCLRVVPVVGLVSKGCAKFLGPFVGPEGRKSVWDRLRPSS